MSALLETSYSASVIATTPVRAYLVENPIEFMTRRPGLAIHAARLLAQRLHDATTYLADLKVQFDDRKDHFGMVDQVLGALMNQQRKVASNRETRSDDPRL
jgi:CRP-like cAMP-binding protein